MLRITVRDLVESLPEGRRRVLVVSPHLDDAAFSAGATIAELTASGVDVHVHTVFAGVPSGPLSAIAATIHEAAGLPTTGDALRLRHAEDATALAVLGASWDHGDALDVIYRRNDEGGWRCEELSAPFLLDPADDRDLVLGLADDLTRLLTSRTPGLVLTCAAREHHVDHVITRLAVGDAGARLGIPVQLWEDLPYGMWIADDLALEPEGEPVAVESGAPAWDRKIDALVAYPSQVYSFWPEASGVDWSRLFLSHGERRGEPGRAELFWPGSVTPPTSPG